MRRSSWSSTPNAIGVLVLVEAAGRSRGGFGGNTRASTASSSAWRGSIVVGVLRKCSPVSVKNRASS
jgi:hypothetical protein